MKKYLSILDAAVNSTFTGIMTTLLVLSAGELGYFSLRLLLPSLWTPDADEFGYQLTFLDDISGPVIPTFACAALIMILFFLGRIQNRKNVRTWYTIRRLSLPERDFYLILTGYTFLVFLLLVLVQILLYMAMYLIFTSLTGAGSAGSQDFFLVFVMDSFASTLLPLGYPLWLASEILLLMSGASVFTLISMIEAHTGPYHLKLVDSCLIIVTVSTETLYFTLSLKQPLILAGYLLLHAGIIVISFYRISAFQRKELSGSPNPV